MIAVRRLLKPQAHLIALARLGRRLPHWLLLLVVSFVATIAMAILGAIPAFLLVQALGRSDGSALGDALRQVIQLVGTTALIFAFIWAWLRWFDRRPLWTIGLERVRAGRHYARGLAVGLALFGGAVAILALLGVVGFQAGDPRTQGLAALGGVLVVALGWVVQGASEEILCRGWLMQSLGARYRPWIGVLVSSLFFAALHSLNLGLSPLALVNLFLFGLFAAVYALREGGLWGVFAIHSVWNWAQGNLFGLEVSGTEAPGGTLLNLEERGADLVTGGPFGPEGGLAVTVVLLRRTPAGTPADDVAAS